MTALDGSDVMVKHWWYGEPLLYWPIAQVLYLQLVAWDVQFQTLLGEIKKHY